MHAVDYPGLRMFSLENKHNHPPRSWGQRFTGQQSSGVHSPLASAFGPSEFGVEPPQPPPKFSSWVSSLALKHQRLLFQGQQPSQALEDAPILLEMASEVKLMGSQLFPADGRLPTVEGVLWILNGEDSDTSKWMKPGEPLPKWLTQGKGYDAKKGVTPYTWLKLRVKAPEGSEFMLTFRAAPPYASRNFLFRSQNIYLSRIHPDDTARAVSEKTRPWRPITPLREDPVTFELNQNLWLMDRNTSGKPLAPEDYETFHYSSLREPEGDEANTPGAATVGKPDLTNQPLLWSLMTGQLKSTSFASHGDKEKDLTTTQRYQEVVDGTRQLMDDIFTRLNMVSPVYWAHYQG